LILTLPSFGISFKEFLYRKGIAFFNSGNYVGALEIFNYLGKNYKLSGLYLNKLIDFFEKPPRLDKSRKEPKIRVKIGEFKKKIIVHSGRYKLVIKVSPNGFKVLGKTYRSFEINLKEPTKLEIDDVRFSTVGGKLRILKYNGRNILILILPLEKYLLGVLPSEVYQSWNIEALKAQAVASRTFALYNILKRKKAPYDVDSGTNFQVFKYTLSNISPKVKVAVTSTSGEILTFNGKPIYAMFHSNSGGATQSFKRILGLDLPYLSHVEDPYSLKAPKWVSWHIKLSPVRFNVFPFHVLSFDFTDRIRGRVRFLKLYTEQGTYKIPFTFTGRLLLKIPSDWCYKLGKIGAYSIIAGRGFGHGFGMSQWGAEVMAEEGKTYKEILKFYYRGIEIKKVY